MGGMPAWAQDSGQQPTPQRGAPVRGGQNQDPTAPVIQPGNPAARQQPEPNQPAERDARAPTVRAEQPSNRTIQRQGLGLQFDPQVQKGLSVTEVQPGSVAAQAGLQAGDRILSVDGYQFNGQRQLQAYLGGQYGRRIPVIIERSGSQQTLQLSQNEQAGDVAWLGVYLNDNQENERGAVVAQVYPSGPAARAGLYTGDVVQQVNGQQVATSADLIATIEEMQPGAKAELALLRNNEPTKVTVTLGSRDSFVSRGQNTDRYDRYGGNQGGESHQNGDDYDIPQHAMELEHTRRMAEQHQRIETEIAKLRDEVRMLREALQKR